MTERVVTVTWDHAKQLGYCGHGLREWFAAKDRGMTYLQFVKNGAPSTFFRSQDDAMADKLADHAEKEA